MKKEYIAGIIVVLVALGGLGYYGYTEEWFDGKVSQVVVVNQDGGVLAEPTATETVKEVLKVPIETLKTTTKNKYTMASATGTLHFYTPGTDVSDPYQLDLDSIYSAGSGSTTNYVIQTGTAYDVYFNGSSTYYDDKISPSINYNAETGKGYMLINGMAYLPVAAFGSFVDVDTLPEKQAGVEDKGTDLIVYNKANLSGSMWIRMNK